jgi:hypothetical protein
VTDVADAKPCTAVDAGTVNGPYKIVVVFASTVAPDTMQLAAVAAVPPNAIEYVWLAFEVFAITMVRMIVTVDAAVVNSVASATVAAVGASSCDAWRMV